MKHATLPMTLPTRPLGVRASLPEMQRIAGPSVRRFVPVRIPLGVLANVFFLSAIAPAHSDEGGGYPRVSGEILVEIQNDWTYHSDDRDAELNDLYTTTESTLGAQLTSKLGILVHGVFEPVEDPGPRDDRAFEDHGLFVEDLYIQFEDNLFSVKGGKFTPNFGAAWDRAPGIYGADFAEDTYEFTERIGFGGSLTLRHDRLGEHELSASTFFLDTSFLSHSTLDGRQENNRSDGGAGNTEDPSSFPVSIDGVFPELPEFSYHIAGIHQDEGRGDETGEDGIAVAAEYTASFGDIEIVPFVEYVYFDDADGVEGAGRGLLSTSLFFGWGGWNLALSQTSRDTDAPDAAEVDDELFQVSMGYEFDFGLTLDVGWRTAEEEGVESEILSFLADYILTF